MAEHLVSHWKGRKCSPTKAYGFVSSATDIIQLRKDILDKLKSSEKECECRTNFVAVVFSKSRQSGVSSHIGVVTESYNDYSTPFSSPSIVWILPDEKK